MSASTLTLIVNHKAIAIPANRWQMVAAKVAYSAVQIMQDFSVKDDGDGEHNAGQSGSAGDYIVELSGGPCVVVPARLFHALFREIGGEAA